jgi:aspartyl-tRNA(Asn)/glutamyl-tRNA(Gln) amidotransferase subunit A
MAEELFYKTAAELSVLLSKGEVSSLEIMEAALARTKAVDGKVKAFVSYNEDDALAQAKASDERRANGQVLSDLDGIPVAIKDVISVKNHPLTASSKILEKYISPYDATSTTKLRDAGAIVWGRLNLDEFAMGSSTENSAFQTTSNPWNLECVPGGSSGGSAAAVAAGESIMTLGSDTGGSIRQPAALCGVVGFKPTYGMVSRYGLAAFASSLDQIGPFTRTVEDAAMLLQAISGHDPKDSTSVKVEIPNYRNALTEKKGPWRLGLPKEYFSDGLDPEVKESVMRAIEFYKAMGCEIVDVSLPHTDLAVPVYYIIATAEASSNLARYDGMRYTSRAADAVDGIDLYFKTRGEGFGPEVKRRIILGTYVLSSGYYDAYYLRAQKVRTLIRQDFVNAFEKVDALITPTTPTPAFKAGEKNNDPISMYLSDIFTISTNLAGLPALSLPCGFSKSGLPIGLQLIGQAYKEDELLAVAHAFEQGNDYWKQTPTL